MARVNQVAAARKPTACGKCGAAIKPGDSYRWWKFRFGGKHVRCSKPTCAPKGSDLTQSEFYGRLSDAEDTFSDIVSSLRSDGNPDDAASSLEELSSDIEELGSEQTEKFDNMPEGLQQGDTGQLLEERASFCEELASTLADLADTCREKQSEFDEPEVEDDEDEKDEKAGWVVVDSKDVAVGQQCPVLGTFDSESAASEFITTLPEYEMGRYSIDSPAVDTDEDAEEKKEAAQRQICEDLADEIDGGADFSSPN